MSLPTINEFRWAFETHGYPVVDLNGDGPGFQTRCPRCSDTLRVFLDENERPKMYCPTGCTFSRIADVIQAEPVGGFAAVEAVGGVTGIIESGTSLVAPVDRYSGRRVDLGALLARPPRPIPWRVHDVVADGTLTIISGESGAGKSWLAQALCSGVAHGRAVAGLLCAKGTALYIDAEMGPEMFVDQRLRPAGVTAPEFEYIDAMGLDISKPDDLAWLHEQIVATGANLVVKDSCRRLTPSKAENESDGMAPTIAALAKLARDTGAAIILIHHKGDSEKFYRGSTAIKDQADALFALLRDPDDEDAPRRLRCRGKGKMRYSLEPPDVYLTINPAVGGVAAADAPDDDGPKVPIRDAVAQAIRAALPAKTKAEVALKVGRPRNDVTLASVWKDLEASGDVVEISGVWQLSSYLQTLGTTGKTTTDPGTVA
jgi:hypothetical protein